MANLRFRDIDKVHYLADPVLFLLFYYLDQIPYLFIKSVMTTVGYGNQAPVTTEGRALVAGLAWITIIMFGGISLVAGK